MGCSALLLAPVALLRRSWADEAKVVRAHWRGIAYIGAFMAIQLGLNNISLTDITLTLNQIIR